MADPADEVIWPDAAFAFGAEESGIVKHGAMSGFIPPLLASSYEGIAVEITLGCGTSSSDTAISLLPLLDPVARTEGSGFIEVVGMDPVQYIAKVNSIALHCVSPQAAPGDTDGDGCSDAAEAGSDPTIGGDRDWLNPWDFYDVDGPGGSPDGVVDLFNDIMGVVNRIGTAPGPPYDVQYDRGPWGPNSWNDTGPPDGVIDLFNDLNGVIPQNGHNCT